MDRRRSKSEVCLHLVWATWLREPLLAGDNARQIMRVIEGEARALGCEVLALNGMADHIHMAIELPTRVAIADLMKQAKGVSSAFANHQHRSERFRWQEGYGVFSVSRSHIRKVIRYIENQQHRHTVGEVWPEWEETDESA